MTDPTLATRPIIAFLQAWLSSHAGAINTFADAVGLPPALGRVRRLGRDAATNPNAAPPGSMAAMAQTPTAGTTSAPPAELAYPAKVTLLQDWIGVDARDEKIRAGMRVSAEIKTGDRRVIEYLLSPVMQAAKEAGRER
jgi:hemolysin D